jgi:hypothetical protein
MKYTRYPLYRGLSGNMWDVLPMFLVRNQIRNMLGGETGKITFGRIK